MLAWRTDLDRGCRMCVMQCLGDAVFRNGRVPTHPHEQPSRFGIRRNRRKVHAGAGQTVEQCAVDHIFDNADDRGPA